VGCPYQSGIGEQTAFKVDMDGWAGLCNLQLQRPTDIRAQIAEIAVPAV
jgi:hypothetical protein